MSNIIPVNVPDIGDVKEVDVIEILVAVGDRIKKEDPLITLETDKATMEVPSDKEGIVKAIHVKVGDKISQGDHLIDIETLASVASKTESEPEPSPEPKPEPKPEPEAQSKTEKDNKDSNNVNPAPVTSEPSADKNVSEAVTESQTFDLLVPDIGDSANVDVIEVLIKAGDQLEKDQGMIVLETDKATMEIPATQSGNIVEVFVKVGDKVSQGDKLATLKVTQNKQTSNVAVVAQKSNVSEPGITKSAPMPASVPVRDAPVPDHPQMKKRAAGILVHASPAVRRFARELGADLTQVKGTGLKNRIQKEDVQNFIKFELSRPKATAATGAFSTPQMPSIDHSKWGQVEEKPLSRIQKISSVNLHRNWISIPHVTQHEDADITELDAFRKSLKDEALKDGVRLTPLAFIMKGLVHTLRAFPKFNASLGNDGENLVIKHYYHIGVAVETPDGLTVPVIRDVDKKGIYQLATELGEISAKARDKKLSADDMQGSSFTISSLGGIGGTAFTPIVKWPDVAILGLSRNKMQPIWNGKEFVPRLMLPMSLSYDHRVIDGADAARFVVHLSQTLNDIRRVLLK